MKKFLNEVYRVLKKGGHFTWVDLRGKDMIKATESAFEGVDLKYVPKHLKFHDYKTASYGGADYEIFKKRFDFTNSGIS